MPAPAIENPPASEARSPSPVAPAAAPVTASDPSPRAALPTAPKPPPSKARMAAPSPDAPSTAAPRPATTSPPPPLPCAPIVPDAARPSANAPPPAAPPEIAPAPAPPNATVPPPVAAVAPAPPAFCAAPALEKPAGPFWLANSAASQSAERALSAIETYPMRPFQRAFGPEPTWKFGVEGSAPAPALNVPWDCVPIHDCPVAPWRRRT